MSLPDRIKRVIKDSGLSLPLLAHRLKVARNTIINYRDGITSPPVDFLEKLCSEFSVNPRWMYLGEGNDPYERDDSIFYIDPAVKLVDEALQETGLEVNDRQKQAIIEIIREEMRKQSKDKVKGILRALSGGAE